MDLINPDRQTLYQKKTKWKGLVCCPITTPEPQPRENDTAPQYTADSNSDGTYILREWPQGETKVEVVLKEIVVSKPDVITGFKDK